MTWPTEQEIKAVLLLDGPRRYEYAVKRITDREEVWGLWDGTGWALMGDVEGIHLMPVWPASKYAALCASGVWEGYAPRSIDLDSWISRWIPGLSKDGRKVAMFPTPSNDGVRCTPEMIKSSLEEALQDYE